MFCTALNDITDRENKIVLLPVGSLPYRARRAIRIFRFNKQNALEVMDLARFEHHFRPPDRTFWPLSLRHQPFVDPSAHKRSDSRRILALLAS